MKKHKGTVNRLFVLLAGCSAFALANAQVFTPISTSGYNADVIANGIGTVASSTTGDVDGASYALVSRDFQLDSSSTPLEWGLPVGGQVVAGDRTYQLQDYSANNSLQLPNAQSNGTLSLMTPLAVGKLSLLGTSGSGASTADVVVQFSDGSQTVYEGVQIKDWFYGSNAVVYGIGRISRGDNVMQQSSSDPRLYPLDVTLTCSEQQGKVSSVKVIKTGGFGIVNIFALSGSAPDPLVSASISGESKLDTGDIVQLTTAAAGGSWSSDHPTIASVDNTGKVTGHAAGATTIRYKQAPCSSETTHALTVQGTVTISTNLGTSAQFTVGRPAQITVSVQSAIPTPTVPTGRVNIELGADSCEAILTNGSGACMLTPGSAGTALSLTLSYSGDPIFQTAQDAQTADVLKVVSVVSMTATPNPPIAGESLTFSVNVTPGQAQVQAPTLKAMTKAAPLPTGMISFTDGGASIGSAPLIDGATTLTVAAPTTPGTHSFVATYLGDGFNAQAQSTPLTFTVAAAPVVSASPVPLFDTLWEKVLLSLLVLGWGAMATRCRWMH
ncbi:Ig-like domain repeat protein [Diaphorobacter ruginosibacter]|uniref:Ig-like domain repeat protein n=1 Tax=Diaphorobacter ruginosibacter TaxID=1715720 RepID=UPI00333ECCE7